MKVPFTLFALLFSIFTAAGLHAFDKNPNAKLPNESFLVTKSHPIQFTPEFKKIKNFENSIQYSYKNNGDEVQGILYLVETVKVYSKSDSNSIHPYLYDPNGNVINDLAERWMNGEWVNYEQSTCTYDSNGNKLTGLTERWKNGEWMNFGRYTHTFDSNGNLLIGLDENWENGQWVNFVRYTHTFDSDGNQLTNFLESWKNGQWENSLRETNIYNNNSNLITQIYEQWYNGMYEKTRSSYTYDGNGNLISILEELWDNQQWVNLWNYTHIYDSNDKLISELWELWDNSQWINKYSHTYTNDSRGKLLSELMEEWYNGERLKRYRQTYTYDTNGNLLYCLFEIWENELWVESDGSLLFHVSSEYSDWFYGFKMEIVWKLINVSVAEETNMDFQFNISPNPASDNISISVGKRTSSLVEGRSIVIYNSLGVEMKSFKVSDTFKMSETSTINISIEDFPSGIYFCSLNFGMNKITKSFVVVR